MRRREFLTLMGGAALAWPLAVRAQRTDKLPTIGFFWPDHGFGREPMAGRLRAAAA